MRLAFAFREEFGHDVVIDLIGYRRFGHNEADEPAYTQPEMYAKIKAKKRVSELWAEKLVEDGVLTQEEVEQQRQDVWDELTRLHQDLKAQIKAAEDAGTVEQATGEYQLDRSPSPEVQTAVSPDRLRSLNDELLRIPDGFTVHPKLVKQLERRRQAVGADGGIDWAHAEVLAFASLLTEGVPIRLTGQDVERGTFSQRHMVLHDAKTGQTICPIQSLPGALAPFELHNSPLSEIACLGFEYGYSAEAPETLVLWEAQFGDFGNSAQVIIDQFIVSGLAKWGQTTRLTLLLPHGYEGSGPEHSSARLERFLQLAAEGNIRVANLTTPAQYFHLLRRQARIAKQRPLIIMTPKSLLRLPQATNRLEHLSETRFFPVLGEPRVDAEKVTRLVLCTGKIYYDLVGHPSRQDNEAVAIGRVELLYPFPEAQILELVNSYPNLREVVWVQEEPRNMGARAHMSPRLMQILPQQLKFGYIGRPERASPGEGYPAAHTGEQNRILRTALDLGAARHPLSGEAAGRALSVALPRAVVFDLDDTLLDTTGLEREMLVGLCAAVNEELPGVEFDHLRARYRDGRDHLYERVLQRRDRHRHLPAPAPDRGAASRGASRRRRCTRPPSACATSSSGARASSSTRSSCCATLRAGRRAHGPADQRAVRGCSGARSSCSGSRPSSTRSASPRSSAPPSPTRPPSPRRSSSWARRPTTRSWSATTSTGTCAARSPRGCAARCGSPATRTSASRPRAP